MVKFRLFLVAQILFAFVLVTSAAHAQTGQLQPGQVWGNSKSSQAPATGNLIGPLLDQGYSCSAQGDIIQRGASLWGCLAPGTSGLPLLSQGAGASLHYATLANAGLTNSSITVGSTNISLGATATTVAGLTLTSPTINSGALSGTFTGSPTLSGTNFITLANIVQDSTAWSLFGNPTSGTANYAPFTIGSLTQKVTPAATDLLVLQDQAASGALKYATVSSVASVANNQLFAGGYLNKFRNGTFSVWQRGTAATSIGTSGNYFADGWKVYFAGSASVTALQAAGNNGSLYSLEIEGATSNTDIKIGQRIESNDAAPLASQTATVQFQYWQNTGSTQTPKVSSCYASSTDNFGTCTADLASTSLTACATATWCTESYTFAISANASNGYEVDLDCNAGFTTISVNCRFAAADIRVTPGVTTGINTVPPAPELRSVSAELASCQRFWVTSYGNNVAPGTATRNGMVFVNYDSGGALTGYASTFFPVPMKSSPTLAYYDGAGNISKLSYVSNGGGFPFSYTDNGTPNANTGFAIQGTNGFSFQGYVTSTAGNYFIHYTASAEL